MKRPTVCLPEELKAELERVARQRGVSEAELIREGIGSVLAQAGRPQPRFPLFSSGNFNARNVDKLLEGDEHTPGFGEW